MESVGGGGRGEAKGGGGRESVLGGWRLRRGRGGVERVCRGEVKGDGGVGMK